MQSAADFVARVNAAIINPLLAFLFTLALLLFLWGGFRFIASQGDESQRADGKRHIMWGLIGMFLMASVFAILKIFLVTFNVDSTTIPAELPLNLP